MDKETTIYDIAQSLGLSASTVSRALKGNPIINARTRVKVEECAREMGYRSNAFASNLRTRRTNTIGVIVPRLDSSFMSACLAGMEEVASSEGYNLIISQSHESAKKEAQNAQTMFNSRVDGLIVSLTIEKNDMSNFDSFSKKNIPVVFFDRVPTETSYSCFVANNEKAAFEATVHLINSGCKQLLHVTIDTECRVYADRKNGFLKAVDSFSDCTGNVLYASSLSFEAGENVAAKILSMDPIPDGIFVANDQSAGGCLLKLKKEGMKIPDEVAIVGFNNDLVSRIVSPALSTVHYPGREAGILAAQNLIQQLQNTKNVSQGLNVLVDTELIIRESTRH